MTVIGLLGSVDIEVICAEKNPRINYLSKL